MADRRPVMVLYFHRENHDSGGYALLCTDDEGAPVIVYVKPSDIFNRPQRRGKYRFVMSECCRVRAPYDYVMSSYTPAF